MAARSDAATTPGPNDGAFMSFNVVRSSLNIVNVPLKHRESTPKQIYDRQSLLEIDNAHKHQLSPAAIEKLRGFCILLKPDLETVASPSDATRTKRRRRRCERGRKRGKRGGIRARLRANPTRPALPTLILSNVRSLENKLDEIQLSRSTEHEARDCCVFVFTETWLNDKTPDSAIQLPGLTCCRADRDSSLSGKTRGGGLCVYINKEWCNSAAVVTKNCSSLVEFVFVKCRPFYLPREFTAIVIVAVYISPCANAKDALRELYSAISEQQTNNPDGFFMIAGDFNHANLKSVLPKFYQHVNFATRGNNTLEFVYTTNKNAYRAEPRPHLGYSDHISVMLIPAYRTLLKLTNPVQKQITVWPDNATSALQDCFQDTDWNIRSPSSVAIQWEHLSGHRVHGFTYNKRTVLWFVRAKRRAYSNASASKNAFTLHRRIFQHGMLKQEPSEAQSCTFIGSTVRDAARRKCELCTAICTTCYEFRLQAFKAWVQNKNPLYHVTLASDINESDA
ncbi:hypothetical protein M9458_055929 [Cirrhinus mrigala]|uniref:Endonuclease/exonuclease/phosphatase domain-containing protein n=1 Tax=Cirrhinus mrigala TaxID=683832 RepID=A0ABD0MIV0_CIRMR